VHRLSSTAFRYSQPPCYGRFTPVQLKVIQEIITLVVFGVFATFYFGDHLRWNHAAAAGCLVAAAFFVFSQILIRLLRLCLSMRARALSMHPVTGHAARATQAKARHVA